ncbi:MAG: TlpA disulfide reductase family protein [Aquabacterium sp.]
MSQFTRRALLAAAGLGAAASGAWWAAKRQAGTSAGRQAGTEGLSPSSAVDAATPAASAVLITGDQLTPAFWQQSFATPEGKTLALSGFQGKPLLINFWATWCPPCVKEMPELDRFGHDFSPQGWHVLGLAIDGPTPVKEFLAKVRVGFAIGLAGFGGTELAQALGNQAGGLPFTVLIDAQGRIRHRKMGATTHAELAAWAQGMQAG